MVAEPVDITAAYARLDAIREELRPLEDRVAELKRVAEQTALDLLRAQEPPTVVAARCPFTATHLRNLARANGIPPARRGGGLKKASITPGKKHRDPET